MNKKLGVLATIAASAAAMGIDTERAFKYREKYSRPTKQPLSKEEQDIKIFKAEEKRLTKALKKKQITQEEFDVKIKIAKTKGNNHVEQWVW